MFIQLLVFVLCFNTVGPVYAQAKDLHQSLLGQMIFPNAYADSSTYEARATTETPEYVGDKEAGIKAKEAMNWILTIAVILSAPIMAAMCFSRIDTKIHGVGALVYLVLEIAAFATYEGSATQEFKAYLDSASIEAQKGAFDSAIAITEKKITTAKLRLAGQFAFAAVEIISSILAFVNASKEVAITAAASLGTMAAQCAPVAGACPISPTCVPTGTFILKDNQNKYASMFKDEENPLIDFHTSDISGLDKVLSQSPSDFHSYFLVNEYEDYRAGRLQNFDYDTSKQVMSFYNTKTDFNYFAHYINLAKKQIANLGDFFVPNVFAESYDSDKWKSFGPKIGIIGAGLVAMAAMMIAQKVNATTYLNVSGWIRGAFYIVISTIAIAAGTTTAIAMSNTEKEKAAYEKLQKAITNYVAPAEKPKMNPSSGGYNSAIYNNFPMPEPIDGEPIGELAKESACGEGSSNPCECVGDKCSLKPNKVDFKGFGSFSNVKSALQQNDHSLNSLMNGDLSSAMSAQNELGKNAANLKKDLSEIKDKINLTFGQNGIAPIDFDSNEKQMADTLRDSTQKAFNSLPKDQQAALMNWASGSMPAAAPNDEKEKGEGKDDGGVQKLPGGNLASARPVEAQKDNKAKSLKDLFGVFGDSKNDKKKKRNILTSEEKVKELSKFKSSTQEISKNPDTSIFKMIEIRYFKSAYPTFFEVDDADTSK